MECWTYSGMLCCNLLIFVNSKLCETILIIFVQLTFFIFHWIKGTPFSDEGTYVSESKYSKLTLWEQIDSGVQYTPTRKFLTLAPVIMYVKIEAYPDFSRFLLTSHYTNHHFTALLINTIAFVVIIIAKQPFMIKKRLFGINE